MMYADICIMYGIKIDLRRLSQDDIEEFDEIFPFDPEPGEAEFFFAYSTSGYDPEYVAVGIGIQGFDNFYPDEIDTREILKWIDPVDADRLGGDAIRRAIEKIKEAGLEKSIVSETPKLLLFMHNDD